MWCGECVYNFICVKGFSMFTFDCEQRHAVEFLVRHRAPRQKSLYVLVLRSCAHTMQYWQVEKIAITLSMCHSANASPYCRPVLYCHTVQQAFRLMEFVIQVVHISIISFSKWTKITNICKCLTEGIQGLKAKFKAKWAGSLRFLVRQLAAKVSLPPCVTAICHTAHIIAYIALSSCESTLQFIQ